MALFALGDLHLSETVNKPMDVFGEAWTRHADKIKERWLNIVQPSDVVLIPGDISWAMTLVQATADLDWLGALPGSKVMIRGNHDYWWSGIGKVRSVLKPDLHAVQNDAVSLGGFAVCGTRGWLLPTHPKFDDHDALLYQREQERLKLALDQAGKLDQPVVVMIHYPPLSQAGEDTLFTELLEAYGVDLCVYGHLHGAAHRFAFEGKKNGVEYRLTSADFLDFTPLRLRETV